MADITATAEAASLPRPAVGIVLPGWQLFTVASGPSATYWTVPATTALEGACTNSVATSGFSELLLAVNDIYGKEGAANLVVEIRLEYQLVDAGSWYRMSFNSGASIPAYNNSAGQLTPATVLIGNYGSTSVGYRPFPILGKRLRAVRYLAAGGATQQFYCTGLGFLMR